MNWYAVLLCFQAAVLGIGALELNVLVVGRRGVKTQLVCAVVASKEWDSEWRARCACDVMQEAVYLAESESFRNDGSEETCEKWAELSFYCLLVDQAAWRWMRVSTSRSNSVHHQFCTATAKRSLVVPFQPSTVQTSIPVK
ncbi:hypothetical protein K438DRAFT_519489 [Mycena galopus ATCC 62051]|nr:hypothetical protein K438DRAFT_519489 [Mycena galopus ATCC 62051]